MSIMEKKSWNSHTEEVKKANSNLERQIKQAATEYLLLNNLGTRRSTPFTWFSITKDFELRPLTSAENPLYLSNVATIKRPTLANTVQWIKDSLYKLVDQSVSNPEDSKKYKRWIDKFFRDVAKDNLVELMKSGREHPKFIEYLDQTRFKMDIRERNVRQQIAKILHKKFGDEAFEQAQKWTRTVYVLSQKSIDYIYTLFCNANKVRESRWKRIDQVFHDWDFPFITGNIMANEDEYVKVLIYLIDKNKKLYYWKRWDVWQKERSRKTSQYADILRALTDDQLRMEDLPNLWSEDYDFQRDPVTKSLADNGGKLLRESVDIQNERMWSWEMVLWKRLKSLSSCVEKIIEWKPINDVIGFRISMRWIWDHNFNDIVNISKNWFEALCVSLKKHPEEYVKKWQTIHIRSISVDNKWVFEQDQINEIVSWLNWIAPTRKRVSKASPYIEKSEWIQRMQNHYPEVVNNADMWNVVQSFYDRITWGKARWRNWWYKDFKYNIIFDIKDENWASIWERVMEVQFDDINNGKWMSNYNIRNFERWLNTQSRLSFSVSLAEARKNCEINLKKMCLWANKWTKDLSEQEKKSFFEIPFKDGDIDIQKFQTRTEYNSKKIDKAIVNIINYFLQKWTFILCYDDKVCDISWKLKDGLLTVEDLHDTEFMKNLRICSSLELATQQHSYLQQDRDRKVWIYLPEKHEIWRISLWELINPMNLWKKKDKKYSAQV